MSTFRRLEAEVHDPHAAEAVTFDAFASAMFDRRDYHLPSVVVEKDGRKRRVSYEPERRPWLQVRGITLHQTACDMGERIERYDTIGAHFSVLRSGRVLRHCDSNRVVYHGNGWNHRCVGIELNGLFAGLEDDPDTATDEALKTTWDDPTTAIRETPMQPTAAQLRATRELIRWIIIDTAKHGGTINVLNAHRQSSKDRRNDPGEAVWKAVALPVIAELGLNDGGPGFDIGGYPIPVEWDETRTKWRY